MPEVHPATAPRPRAVIGWDGTAYRVFAVDAAGHIQADVVTSALPAGAATAANQALILAQVEAIEDLTHALQSVATDRLQVRGEDQLYSVREPLAIHTTGNIVGDGGYLQTTQVPPGQIWKVTSITAYNNARPTTAHYAYANHNGIGIWLGAEYRAFAVAELSTWVGEMWLDQADFIRVHFIGGLAGDAALVDVGGHRMTRET